MFILHSIFLITQLLLPQLSQILLSLYNWSKFPHLKFGIVLSQSRSSLPEPKLALSVIITKNITYKVSISLGALAAVFRGIYNLFDQS